MDNKKNGGSLKFIIVVFYSVAMLFVLQYAWKEQSFILKGGSGPLYRNLRECPAFVRKGFDPGSLHNALQGSAPDFGEEWVSFPSTVRRIKNSSLELPKRTYLSPFGKNAEEFTIVILLDIDDTAVAYLSDNISVLPGVSFAGIGENWEVYFNGTLIRSEMHWVKDPVDGTIRIKSNRTWGNAYFPIDKSLVVPGSNALTLRIVGDPTYQGTGLYYSSAPIYFDDYWAIEGRQYNTVIILLCGIFFFTGIYYLLLFLSVRRKDEVYNLYFSIFSILLCIFSMTRHSSINLLIPNSDISMRLENISLMLMILAFFMFIETLGRKKVTKVSWGYAVFCLYLCITQIFFCPQYSEETMAIANVTFMLYFTYVLFYDVFYFYFWDKKKPREGDENRAFNTPLTNILIGILMVYFCGIYDLINSLFFIYLTNLFLYSTFVVQIGMAFTLSQRFTGMYKRLEQSNFVLEVAVHDRTYELERQTKIAIEASRAKSQFLATMSHEIRTPLNAVIGLSEIELRRDLEESSRNNIQQIFNSGSSLLGIINDILDISKIEAGGFELVPAEYETASFINNTVNLNLVRIAAKPITFALEIAGDFPRKLFGDELRVKQILNNVLSNAIKYTNDGVVTLTVAWEKTGESALLRFTVRDTGRGIRTEDMGKLFSNYSQLDTKANRMVEGTGLGLAITKELVEMMDGTVAVESEYGKGSTFTVTIVQGLADSAGIGDETAAHLKQFRYKDPLIKSKIDYAWMPYGKVLVVDDMPVNLQVARGLLEPYGLKIDTAMSGLEAIGKVSKKGASYDIIFMDHMMPGMDGIQAVRIIRNEVGGEYCLNVPIIALTANALVGNMEMFLSKGFNGYISKPIDIAQLDEVLNKWIRNRHGAGDR